MNEREKIEQRIEYLNKRLRDLRDQSKMSTIPMDEECASWARRMERERAALLDKLDKLDKRDAKSARDEHDYA